MAPLDIWHNKQKSLRGIFFACVFALFAWTTGCGGAVGGLTSVTPPSPTPNLTAADVTTLIQAAAQAADPNTMAIAVVDRAGNILAVYRKPAAPTLAMGNFGVQVDTNELAVSLARTAAFFSNDQAPLSSRTVRFISGIHFPPGVMNQPPADLYGIENTNRGCTLINDPNFQDKIPPSLALGGGSGPGVLTGKADLLDSDPAAVNPGGVPIFYKNVVLGGIGVVTTSSNLSVAEYAAFVGATSPRVGA